MDPVTGVLVGLFATGYLLNRNGKTPRVTSYEKWEPTEETMTFAQTQNQYKQEVQNDFQTELGNLDRERDPRPFFGSNINEPNLEEDMRHLDITTNTNDGIYRNKREVTQFFEPQPQYDNNMPSYLQERYEVGTERRFEKPVESFRDIPMDPRSRVLPENPDVYRRTQLEGDVIMGKNVNDQPTQVSNVRYNNAYKFHINSNESMIPTFSDVKANTIRQDYETPMTERSYYDTEYYGNPGEEVGSSNFARNQQVRDTQRGDCTTENIGNAHYTGPSNGGYTYQDFHMPSTEREMDELQKQNTITGFSGPARSNMRYEDNMKTTQKETLLRSNNAEFGFTGGMVKDTQHSLQNMDMTNREMANMHLNGYVSNPTGEAQGVTHISDKQKTTGRETLHTMEPGNATSASYKMGMDYKSMMEMDGFGIRDVTDGNRATHGDAQNLPLDATEVHKNTDLHTPLQTDNAHQPAPTQVYGNETIPPQNLEVNPNKTEPEISSFDPEVLAQLRCNEFNRDILNKSD